MSSIWTPSGERPIGRPEPEPAPPASRPGAGRGPSAGPDDLTDEEIAEQMMAMQQQVLATPATVVVANHCMALFELAALYLSPEPPKLADAQVAIDAMAAVVDAVGPRFGPNEKPLRDGLSQLRMAYVEAKNHLSQPEAPSP
jgi:hypothetical protein